MGWFTHALGAAGGVFVDAANKTAEGIKDGVDATVNVANTTASLVGKGAEYTGKGFNEAGAWVGGAAESGWEATSAEAEAIGHSVESVGITIGTGFIFGAQVAAEGLEEGVEYAGEGLIALGKYVKEQACDLAVGAGLSAVFAALSETGEEEETTGAVAFACSIGKSVEMDLASMALAKVLVEPIYPIPGVSDALGPKDDAEDLIAFLISQACDDHKETVIASAGQFLAGVLIYGLTSAICKGEVPGGFNTWKRMQTNQ